VLSFEANLFGVMMSVTDEEKFSTPTIPMGGKHTHGIHILASTNQLTKKDQAITTWSDKENCIIF